MTPLVVWTTVLAGVVSLAVIAATWRRLASLPWRRRGALAALRASALACLLLALVNPTVSRRDSRTRLPVVAVLLDSSASMSVEDAPGNMTRAAWAASLLAPAGCVAAATADAEAHALSFADTVEPLTGAPPERADGPATDLARAFEAALRAGPAGAPDAIVLLSDGRANRGSSREETLAWLSRRRVPVYAVGVGGAERPPDAWLAHVDAPRTVKAGSEATVTVTVASHGLAGKTAGLSLSGTDVTARADVSLDAASRRAVVLPLRPTRPGLLRLTVQLGEVGGEWTEANNSRTFYVRVTPGRSRLLVLSGGPGLELKFLRRVLDRLPDLDVTYLVGKASRSFVDIDSSRAQRVPGTEALNEFDAVVLQELEAAAVSAGELGRLEQFVGERGGGLGLLGGMSGLSGCAGSAVEQALGVSLTSSGHSPLPAKAQAVTGLGGRSPLTEIERHEDFPGWGPMPLLGGTNTVGGVKPGASALLEAASGAPLLVVQRYGSGRTLCLLTGSTYRWAFSRDATDDSRRGHAAFWSGLVAWLTTPPNRTPVALETDRDVYEAGDTARVVVHVTDSGFQPLSGAEVIVSTEEGEGEATVALQEVPASPGRYETGLALPTAGAVKLTARATRAGAELGGDAREVTVTPARRELADPAQDVAFLQSLATVSGGAYLPPERSSELSQALRLQSTETVIVRRHAWARSAWLLAALLAFASADWFLRRWWSVG